MSTPSKAIGASLFACALALSSVSTAHANEARVEQRGQGEHNARTVQLGRSNSATLVQDGSGHTGSIVQNGDDNVAGMRQLGRRQTGSIVQNGDENAACLIQYGRPGSTSIVQNGGESVAVIQGVNRAREVPIETCLGFVNGQLPLGQVMRRR